VTDALILFAIVFAIHLAPAFTPPTFPVIVFYTFHGHLPAWLIVAVAGLGAASGRLALAMIFRFFAHRLPQKLRGNLQAAHSAIDRRRHSRWIIPGLFLLGSSSAPLFEAAGLAGLRMAPLTAAYFIGRLPRYWLYELGARQLEHTGFWQAFHETLTSPPAIAVELLMIGLVVALIRMDWRKLLDRG
jgi:membrane protein YqaA with SNARE-associated domain